MGDGYVEAEGESRRRNSGGFEIKPKIAVEAFDGEIARKEQVYCEHPHQEVPHVLHGCRGRGGKQRIQDQERVHLGKIRRQEILAAGVERREIHGREVQGPDERLGLGHGRPDDPQDIPCVDVSRVQGIVPEGRVVEECRCLSCEEKRGTAPYERDGAATCLVEKQDRPRTKQAHAVHQPADIHHALCISTQYCAPSGSQESIGSAKRSQASGRGKNSVYSEAATRSPAEAARSRVSRRGSMTALSSNGQRSKTQRVTGFTGLCSKMKMRPL